jgi:acyl carrier protein
MKDIKTFKVKARMDWCDLAREGDICTACYWLDNEPCNEETPYIHLIDRENIYKNNNSFLDMFEILKEPNSKTIEEYMGFVDDNGSTGIILKANNTYYEWCKCFKQAEQGQVFNENDCNYKTISKLYKCKKENEADKKFYALKFMMGTDMDMFECVYDKKKETRKEAEPQTISCTLNITVPNNVNYNDLEKCISKAFEESLTKCGILVNNEVVVCKVFKLIAEQLGINEEEINLNSDLIKDLYADSLDIVELCMKFEDEFDIEIQDEEVARLSPIVNDIINVITNKIEE